MLRRVVCKYVDFRVPASGCCPEGHEKRFHINEDEVVDRRRQAVGEGYAMYTCLCCGYYGHRCSHDAGGRHAPRVCPGFYIITNNINMGGTLKTVHVPHACGASIEEAIEEGTLY